MKLPPRKVLVVDPIYHVHSVVHYRSALGSVGFESTEFTVLTSVVSAQEAERLEKFQQSQPRVRIRLLKQHPPISRRLQCLHQFWQTMRQVERILAQEQFDALIYLMADHMLPVFALPFARLWFPHHFALGVRGLLFRHNGLRKTATTARRKCLELVDRWIMRRSLRSGGFTRLSFLDREAGRRAGALEETPICGEGVDPVDFPDCDRAHARSVFGLSSDDFVFLMFGSIDDRKGVIEAIESLRAVENPDNRIVVLIAGRIAPALRPRLQAMFESCDFRVVLHDRFVLDEDLPNYFAAADCVVCSYKDFTASSGVLLHGASCGDLAVVSAQGVMEDAVREFGFGEVVEVEDRAAFASALRRLMHLSPTERDRMSAGARRYARTHDFRLYMTQFLTLEEAAQFPVKA